MNEWIKTLIMAGGGGTFVVLLQGIINRKTSKASTDSIVVQSSGAVVTMLNEQMAKMAAQITALQAEVDAANERALRLEIHVEHLEQSVIRLGGTVPERPRERRRA
jgi:outer membrane murein-binding lipoprotein Lpp